MRRNFAQVLKSGNIDPKKEYSKLYDLFYGKNKRDGKSLADIISMNFECFYFRGTCLDLEEFDEAYGFRFVEQPQDFSMDYLVSFCEYIYNFVIHFESVYDIFEQLNKSFYLQQIRKVIEAIGYMESFDTGLTIFVPKDNVAIAVSESKLIPENVSYKVIAYNHHSMKGDVEAKRVALLAFYNILEPYENKLSQLAASFKRNLFFAMNNFNIRHNNINPLDKTYYKKIVAEMSSNELEKWYDEIYQMCLYAFMLLEQNDRNKDFEDIKNQIEAKE